MGLGHPQKARPLVDDALATQMRILGEDHETVARSLFIVANNRLNLGDPAAAKPLLEHVLSIDEDLYGEDSAAVGVTLASLVFAEWRLGNFAFAGSDDGIVCIDTTGPL